MEYIEKGSLYNYLELIREGLADVEYDNTNRQIILIGISYGMSILHKNHILHRDLKPTNILLDSKYKPHIIDFGLSKFYEKGKIESTLIQVTKSIYLSPETIKRNVYNEKTDVYSFGILMFEVVTEQIPYPEYKRGELTDYEFSRKVIDENYRPIFEVPVKRSIKKLIESCWSKDPNERPTFDEIFNKLAFNEGNWIIDFYEGKDTEDEYDVNKYFLDNVDEDAILDYIDEIRDKSPIEEMNEIINNLMKTNEKQSQQINKLAEANGKQSQQINKLTKANEKQSQQIDILIEANEKQSQQINQITKTNIKQSQQINKLTEVNEKQIQQIDILIEANEKQSQQINQLTKTNIKQSQKIDKLPEANEKQSQQIDKLTEANKKQVKNQISELEKVVTISGSNSHKSQISFNVYNEKCVWDNCNKGITSFINNKYCINITVDIRSTAEDLYNEVSKQIKVNSNCIRIFKISQDEKTFGKVIKPTDKLSLIHNQNIFAQFKDEKENLEISYNTRIFFIILYTPNSPKPFIFIQMRKYKVTAKSTYGFRYPKYEEIIDDIAQLLSTNLQVKISNKDISVYLINNHKLLEKSDFLDCFEDNGTIMIIQIYNPSISIDTAVRSTLKSKLKIKKYFQNIESNDDSEQSEIFRYMDYMVYKLPKAVDKYFELRNNTRKSEVYDYSDINCCKGVIEFPKSIDKENLVSFIALAFGLNINDQTDAMLLFSREENLNVPKSRPFNLKSSYSSKLSTTENINNIYYLIAPIKNADNYRSETRIIQISKNAYSISKTICYYLSDEDCHPFSVFKLFTEDSFITGDETRMFVVDENNLAGAIIEDGTNDDHIKLDNKNKLRIEKIPNDQKSKQLVLVYRGYLNYNKIQFFGEPLYFGYDDNESVKSFKSRISKFLNITKPFKLYNDSYSTSFSISYSERNVLKDKNKVTFDGYSKNKVLVLLFDNNDA